MSDLVRDGHNYKGILGYDYLELQFSDSANFDQMYRK